MRVLIDATSILLRSAGIKSYTYHWLRQLEALAPPGSIRAFPFLDDPGELNHQRSPLSPAPTYARLALLYLVNYSGSLVINRLTSGIDIFHASNQVRNPPTNVRLTATVHDLTCWLLPEVHTPANVRADQSFAKKVWKTADGLIAVSENTRQDVIRILDVNPDKITTIHSGVAPEYFDAVPTPADRPYVLFVGAIEPRKNVDTLLDAWLLVRPDLRARFDLRIAGATGWSSGHTLARLQSGIESVQYLGYVPEADLPGLTAGATAFVYPSLYEGFGLPVAQAMASSVPVITSNLSSLPEIAGEGALLIDPRSATEIATALDRLLSNLTLQDQIGSAARARAQRFSWEACAEQSLAFFEQVLG